MNDKGLLQYIDRCKENRRYIFILPTSDMFTKKGTIRKAWLSVFFNIDAGDEEDMSLPNGGGCIEEGIAIHVPGYHWFYLMSYNNDGWEGYIQEIAIYRNTMYGKVVNENLVLSNGTIICLADCEINAYNPIPTVSTIYPHIL